MKCDYDFPVNTIKVDEIGSTNNYLIELCDKSSVEPFTTVWCDFQTHGKGQRGNSWESEDGKNLTFSTVVFPKGILAAHQFVISMITALTIKDVLDGYADDIKIKWPNDIYWKDKKICGILIENDLAGMYVGRSVLGIGININQREFLSDAPNPVSLYQITGREESREKVLSNITQLLKDRFECLASDKESYEQYVYDDFLRSLYRSRGFFSFEDENGVFIAKIKTVMSDGHLVLERENGDSKAYAFKEVQYII